MSSLLMAGLFWEWLKMEMEKLLRCPAAASISLPPGWMSDHPGEEVGLVADGILEVVP